MLKCKNCINNKPCPCKSVGYLSAATNTTSIHTAAQKHNAIAILDSTPHHSPSPTSRVVLPGDPANNRHRRIVTTTALITAAIPPCVTAAVVVTTTTFRVHQQHSKSIGSSHTLQVLKPVSVQVVKGWKETEENQRQVWIER